MTQALLACIRSLANDLAARDISRNVLIQNMHAFYEELAKIEAAHEARVTELLDANNREVERRRLAEAAKAESDKRYRKACDREAELILERQAAQDEAEGLGHKCDKLKAELGRKAIIDAPAPETSISELQRHVEREMDRINAQRDEILEAFIAKYGCGPDEIVQVVQGDRWWLQRLEVRPIVHAGPEPIEPRAGA